MVKKKESAALVEVLRPETAYTEAKTAFDALAPHDKEGRLHVNEVPIRSVSGFDDVNDTLRRAATAKKSIEGKRKGVTKHLDAAKKAINTLFAPMLDSLVEYRVGLEAKLDEYDDWKYEQQEAERLAIQKKSDAARKRAQKTADDKLCAARTREMRKDIKRALDAKLETQQAVTETRLADVDDTPDAAEGVARIDDVEVTIVNAKLVPAGVEYAGKVCVLWERVFNMSVLKQLGKADVEVPGVTFERTTRRAVRSL